MSNGGVPTGTVSSSNSINVADSFSGLATFIGTPGNDTFVQSGVGTYVFDGGLGANTLDLSATPAGASVSLTSPDASCSTGIKNNDGSTSGAGVNDTFACIGTLISAGSEYQVQPGQTATVNGGGSGTLALVNDPSSGSGVTVTLPVGSGLGTVAGDGYNFSFTGMSTVVGTQHNDLFIPGTSNVTIDGGGGSDGVSFANAPAAVVVNLSGSSYTIPPGLAGAGTSVPAFTATGGYGGTITLNNVANVSGTARFNDLIVAGPGPGALVGGTGNDTFVLTGGDDSVNGGGGSNTLDLSELPGFTTFNLGLHAKQFLGAGAGSVTVTPGTIQKVIASPGGSALQAGPGNITLVGGPGNDWLAAGTGNDTLIGGGGNDTLIAGIGTDNLQGGAQPVTFVPGQGTDVLTSQLSGPGNTLSYSGVPVGARINLSSQLVSVPPNEPFAGTVLPAETASGGWGANVDLSGAEINRVIGSSAADIFVTGSGASTVSGNGGNDLFVVTGGNNTLTAGNGSASRFLFEGGGSNVIHGGGKATVDFSQAPSGVTVDLQHGQATGGFGGLQALTGVFNITGSQFNDVLVAGAPGGEIIGLNGNDLLQAGPSGGNLLVGDGSGNDTFCAQNSCARGGTSAHGGDTMLGGSGDDTFFALNGSVDTINGGGGFNSAHYDNFDHVTNIQHRF